MLAFRRNGGSGTARRIGTPRARGEIVVWTDADMTYPNERIPELVRMLLDDSHYDQVVGARLTEEGTHKWLRVPAKWFIRKVAERLSNQQDPGPQLRPARVPPLGGAALPAAAAARVLLRHDDHARVPVATSTTSGTCRSSTRKRAGTSQVPLRPRRLPLHPPGAADGHVLRPAQGAHAAGAVARSSSAGSRPSSTWCDTRSTSRPAPCCSCSPASSSDAGPARGPHRALPGRRCPTMPPRCGTDGCASRWSGPTHPYKGGVAAHTTQLAHELAAAGHDVDAGLVVAPLPGPPLPRRAGGPGRRRGPRRRSRAPSARCAGTGRVLVAHRRQLRGFDLVVIVVVVPVQVPALLALVRRGAAAGARGSRPRAAHRRARAQRRSRTRRTPAAEYLMTRMLRAADAVLVHSGRQAELADGLGARGVVVAELPPHLPGGAAGAVRPRRRPGAPRAGRTTRCGCSRSASSATTRASTCSLRGRAPRCPACTLTVAGELWGDAGRAGPARWPRDPELRGPGAARARATSRPTEVPALLAAPRRPRAAVPHGTASQNVLLGHAPRAAGAGRRRPAPSRADVTDGVDGLLVPPDDAAALAARAAAAARSRASCERLRGGVPDVDIARAVAGVRGRAHRRRAAPATRVGTRGVTR